MSDERYRQARAAHEARILKVREANRRLISDRGLEPPYVSCEVGLGWIPLMERTLDRMIEAGMLPDQLAQVKSKFCILKIYVDHDANDLPKRARLEAIIREAEKESCSLCEDCGAPHGLVVPRAGTALCDQCYKIREGEYP